MAPKRAHKTLTLTEKFKILQELKRGVSASQLAAKYGIGNSTITDIKKRSQYIENFVARSDSGHSSRKTLKEAKYKKIEAKLHFWILLQRRQNAPISSESLAEKAKRLYAKYYGNNDFQASKGWIRNFKKRHGLHLLGKKLPKESSSTDELKKNLEEKIKSLGLLPTQLYIADESALFWKLLPNKTVCKEEAPGKTTSKDRLTFLACSNADGSHKLKLLVVGKLGNHRALKNAVLPVEYRSNSKASMTSDLFSQWFHDSFVKQVEDFSRDHNLPPKAVLIVNKSEELVSNDGNIVTMFLPALTQQMEHNLIRITKLLYKKDLLSHILCSEEDDISICLENLSIRDAICFLFNAWDKINARVLENCLSKLLKNEEWDKEDKESLSVVKEHVLLQEETLGGISALLNKISGSELTRVEVNQWIDGDYEEVPFEYEGKIEEEIKEEGAADPGDYEEVPFDYERKLEEIKGEGASHPGISRIGHDEATKSFRVCLEWAEQNGADLHEIVTLQRLKEKALLLSQNN